MWLCSVLSLYFLLGYNTFHLLQLSILRKIETQTESVTAMLLLFVHLEYFFLRTLRPKDSVEREINLPMVLDSPLCCRIFDADLFRVVRKVGDECAACGLRRLGQAPRGTLWRQTCLGVSVVGRFHCLTWNSTIGIHFHTIPGTRRNDLPPACRMMFPTQIGTGMPVVAGFDRRTFGGEIDCVNRSWVSRIPTCCIIIVYVQLLCST